MSFKIESNYDYVFLEWGSCYTEAYEFFGMANNFDVNITGSYSQVNEFSLKDNYYKQWFLHPYNERLD